MRIVEVVDIGYVAGGAEKSVKLIRDELIQRGHEVLVLSTSKLAGGKSVFADELVPAIDGSAPERLIRYAWNRASYRTMRRIIRDFRPDVVHLHTVSEFSPALLWGLGRTPSLLTVHGPEEFTLRLLPWLLPAGDYRDGSYAAKDLKLTGRLRYCYYRFFQRPLWRFALRRVRLVVAPSKYMADEMKPDFPRTSALQLYNGIQLPRRRELPSGQSTTILYVGRLEAVKGVDHLIRAFAAIRRAYPDCRLRIVGEGSQRQALQDLAAEVGLDGAIAFPGWVEPRHIADEFGAASIVVIPSVWPENLPTVAIEALAIGRPIIGSDTGGISELIDDGVNGRLVAPGDETALTQALDEFLGDRTLLKAAARASADKASAFDDEVFVTKLLAIYQELTQ